ncbi:putative MarR family transcriptional regulator [Actinacidiphila reveromycinica]|uniref:Putative MarR family transcriptional regulator n=1 Tax=Actinacidiphila reveromycinica TaxID=659352 RepID=A0A7U3UTC8_9ACTN|nr:MarR family transcriptional regulator [Streptomyces sp. SN-593]BBA99945.1 putative MarR family transcriptional regulator [Streptomyces sp. SN-593]
MDDTPADDAAPAPGPAEGGSTDPAALAGELRVAVGRLVRKLREQTEGGDLTRSQTSVLLRIERDGPATATVLARAEGIRPQSMAKIVGALQDAGLVVGSPDPQDGRKTLLGLTTAAREQFRTGRLAKHDWLTQAIGAQLSAEEVARLASCTDLLRRIAQAP